MLLNLDLYGRHDPDGMFLLFCKQVVRELAPKLAVTFKHLVKGGSFQASWKSADVDHMPTESPSWKVGDHRSISITLLLSKLFEKRLARKWSHFWRVIAYFLLLSFCSVGAWNMRCFAHNVSPSTSCYGQGKRGKACSVGLLTDLIG